VETEPETLQPTVLGSQTEAICLKSLPGQHRATLLSNAFVDSATWMLRASNPAFASSLPFPCSAGCQHASAVFFSFGKSKPQPSLYTCKLIHPSQEGSVKHLRVFDDVHKKTQLNFCASVLLSTSECEQFYFVFLI
jgi:hypothetical protein